MFYLAARSWPWILARGIFAVIFGVLALVWPDVTLVAIALMIGFWLLLDGVGLIFNAIAASGASGGERLLFALLGVLSVVAGIIAFVNPFTTLGALAILIAVWFIVSGIGQIATAIRIRKAVTGEWLLVISGILAIIAGAITFSVPGVALATGAIIIGVVAVIYGISLVVAAVRLRKLVRDADRSA